MAQNANDVRRDTVALWLDAALKQIAAESYLNGVSLTSEDALVERLVRGNTPLESDVAQYLRLTFSQATDFVAQYEIVDHHANDASGFSATLLRRKVDDPLTAAKAGEYTLAFRSTEYKNPSLGGDYDRDGFLYGGLPRADGEIGLKGFAQGQLAAMEAYYQQLKLGITSTDPEDSAQLNTLGRVNTSVRDFFGNASSTFNVVGYSLGAHLATVFTERHADVVSQGFTFNAAGRGALGGTAPGADTARLDDMYAYFMSVLVNPDAGGDPRRLAVSRTGVFDQAGIDLYRAAKRLAQSALGQGFDPFKLDSANLATDSSRRNLYVDARYRWATYATTLKFSSYQPGTAETKKDITLDSGAFAKITQLFGHANFGDMEVTANSGVHAPTTSIFIEAQPFLEGLIGRMPFAPELTNLLDGKGDFGNTHSLTLVIDSLAVMEAFMTADETLTKRQVETVFSGASNQRARGWGANSSKDSNAEGNSLELPLDELRKLYGAQGVRYVEIANVEQEQLYDYGVAEWATPVNRGNGGFGNAGNRRILYRNIELLKNKIAEKGSATITSLLPESQFEVNNGEPKAKSTGPVVQTIIDKAKKQDAEGLAYRYALRELNPFVVTGNTALYSDALRNELSYYDQSTGQGVLSDKWIEDRAEFLAYKLAFNVFNKQFDQAANPLTSVLLQDIATKTRATLLNNLQLASARTYEDQRDPTKLERYLAGISYDRRILFAEDSPAKNYVDILHGAQGVDHLYGGLGNDQLNGNGGEDYLDGGVGNDDLDGGAADDTLLGGAGNDTLRGGQGNDTYIWRRGDGFDKIVDYFGDSFGGDGLGKIEFLGDRLDGDKSLYDPATNDKLYQDDNNFYVFTGLPGTRGTLTIVRRNEAPDFGGVEIENFTSGDFGIKLTGTPTFTKTDQTGSDANDDVTIVTEFLQFFGFGGNDRIVLAAQLAEGWGGVGDDFISSDEGDQTLRGEAGRDILLASGGSDTLLGGSDDDALQGGDGNDYLDGEEGNDVVDGGLGSDVVNGGAGNDFIAGGGSLVVSAPWFANAVPVFGANVVPGQPTGLVGISGFVAIDGDEGDVLDGGAGNDTIFAGSGDDLAEGGDGDDLVSGDAGADTVSGGDGDDALFGDATQGSITIGGNEFYTLPEYHGNDVLIGGLGNDTLQGDGGGDELYGGAGNDVLIGDANGLDEAFHGADYLDGGGGNDLLLGYGKDDYLFGGEGYDELGGDSSTIADSLHGDDYLDGEGGDDTLHGDGGSDQLFGGGGNDILDGDASNVAFEYHGDDYLDGEAGDDSLQGGGGSDDLFGGDGNDSLVGDGPTIPDAFAGDDYLDGEAGNDVLEGGAGNDTLIGGSGSDILRGQAGDDLYILSAGDQQDFVEDREGINTLRFDSGGTFASMSVTQSLGSDGKVYLAIRHTATDTVYVQDGLTNESMRYEFADGTTVQAADWRGRLNSFASIFGTSGADTMSGTSLANFFAPGNGNDTILFGVGSGFDRVSGFGQVEGSNSGLDVVRVGGGLVADDLDINRDVNGNLLLKIRETGDLLRLDGWSATVSQAHAGAQVVFDDGSGLSASDLIARAQVATDGDDVLVGGAGADVLAGGAGNDRLYGNSTSNPVNVGGDDNILLGGEGDDLLQGGLGNDVLDGGQGNDKLIGGAGADTYIWGLGDGVDVVTGGWGEGNIVELRAGLTPDDVTFTQGSIVITINTTGESLTLEDWYGETGVPGVATPNVTVDEVRFADGTVWDASLINENANHATPFSDVLRGTWTGDVLQGLDGDDQIDGYSGDDALSGGDGADTLNGSWGADDLEGGRGDDLLSGDRGGDVLVGGPGADRLDADFAAAGDDWLDGGPGDDVLNGGGGDDIYLVRPGDGFDQISEVGLGDQDDPSRDEIVFASGIEASDVRVFGDWSALVIDYGSGQLQLPLSVAGDPGSHGMETVRFADGTIWSRDDLLSRTVLRPQVLTASGSDLSGGNGDDLIYGNDGDNFLRGNAGHDTIYGGRGQDLLQGGEGNDVLYGGDGVDTLLAEAGDDFLDGGPGDDQLQGGHGSDTYRLGLDTGHDLVIDAWLDPFYTRTLPGDRDTVVVDDGIAPADLIVARSGVDLLLETPASGSSLTIASFFASEFGLAPFAVRFADGTEWDQAQLGAMVGYVAPDELDEILAGTAGNDVLRGGYGNDTYLFGFGSGQDTIEEPFNTLDRSLNRASAGAHDVIRFGAGVTPQDVIIQFNLARPTFALAGTTDTLTIASWDDAAAGRIEFAEFEDGTVWDLGKSSYWGAFPFGYDAVTGSVRNFGASGTSTLGNQDELFFGLDGANFVNDLNGHDTLYGGGGNDTLNTGSGDDQIDAGAGNDSVSPGTGDNRVRFGRGFGQDTLNRATAANNLGVDTVVFGQDVTTEQIRLRWGPNGNLLLELAGTPDVLTITGALRGLLGRDRLRFEFADGTAWGADAIEAHIQSVALIEGGSGNNVLTGGDGDDLFIGGEGNDTLIGGLGNDTFVFNRGDGVDTVNDRFPRIVFGEGIVPGDVTLSGSNFAFGQRDLRLTVSGGGGELLLQNWFDQTRIDGAIEFADGTVWDARYIGTRVPYAWTSGQAGFFFGTPGADSYSAASTDDTMRGHEGDDTLSGNAGNDQLYGGSGDDALSGGTGNDTVQGDSGNDTLTGGAGNDQLNGGTGDDLLDAGVDVLLPGETDDDTLVGGSGNDVLIGRMGDDSLNGGADNDLLDGGAGNDLLEGGRGDDELDGGPGDDRLYGGQGSDLYRFGLGSGHDLLLDFDGIGVDVDRVLMGEGIAPGDLVVTRQAADLVLAVGTSGDSLAIRTFGRAGYGVEQLVFSDGTTWSREELEALAPLPVARERADVIFGTAGDDSIAGLAGDDYLDGRDGNDVLNGGAGDDVLSGGDGDDILDGGAGSDYLVGGAGADVFLMNETSGSDSIGDFGAADVLQLGTALTAGEMRVARDVRHLYLEVESTGQFITLENWFEQGSAGVVAFADGTVWDGALLLSSVETATEGDDFLVGTAESDSIASLGGFDVVYGQDGDDLIDGGDGSDTLYGESGSDTIFGGAGYDFLDGGEGNDTLEGGADDDALYGQAGDDVLRGGVGFDELNGGVGNDVLEGGADDDNLVGDLGDDVLEGGEDNDTLTGGLGSDTYIFAPGFGADSLEDTDAYAPDVNVVRMTGIAADAVTLRWSGTDFLLQVEGAPDTLLMHDPVFPHLPGIQRVEFDDGTAWSSVPEIYAHTIRLGTEGDDNLTIGVFLGLEGLGGNDVLTGGPAADLLDGGAGNDVLRGQAGGDTYRFGPGYGADVIIESDTDVANVDTVLMDALPADVAVSQIGSDLQIALAGGADRLTVQGWFDGAAMQIERLQFADGSVWDAETLTTLAGGVPPAPLQVTQVSEPTAGSSDVPPDSGSAVASAVTLAVVADLTPAGDFYRGSGGDDVLNALEGDDTVFAGTGNDVVFGQEGDDYLAGEAGDDTLDGGPGRDILEGGSGDDRYAFGAGYGEDWILDTAGVDQVIVDASISPAATTFTRDLANLYVTAGADRLVLVDWFYRPDTRVESLAFSDGTLLDESAIRLSLQVPAGTGSADTIFGSDRGETLLGLAGEDTLYGEGGDDLLDGGAGTDYLLGGTGDDTYIVDNRLDRVTELAGEGIDTVLSSASFVLSPNVENLTLQGGGALSGTGSSGDNVIVGNPGPNSLRGAGGDDRLVGDAGNDVYLYDRGDGNDEIEDVDPTPGNLDEVRFGAGIAVSNVRVTQIDQDIRLRVAGSGDILLRNWFDEAWRVEAVQFADGTRWDAAMIEFLASQPANEPPEVAQPIGDQSILEDEAFVLTVQPGTFVDADAGDVLVIHAALQEGSPLPAWLAFEETTATFSGTPANEDVGTYSIEVTATDPAGESASDAFVLSVLNVNDVPELLMSIPDQVAEAGVAFELTLDPGMFRDVDAGDVVTLTATSADGLALPDWLTFDPTQGVFTGTPSDLDAGALDVQLTATDLAGATASDQFRISILGSEPTGVHLEGTERPDILVGTPYDDLLEGLGASDLLLGLGGDDRLDGGAGNDYELGGGGNDTYLYQRGAGHDLILETGGDDALQLGEGIAPQDVQAYRRQGDLVLRVRGDDSGSVTIQNWFVAASKRVEKVQFADGTTWDEAALRERARGHELSSWWHQGWDEGYERGGSQGRFNWLDRKTVSNAGDEGETEDARDSRNAIAAWLGREARYEFNALADNLRRDGRQGYERGARDRIAHQWRAIQVAVSMLDYSDNGVSINSRPLALGTAYSFYGWGWGYASSTGQQTAYGGMEALTGLSEGFEKLG